jgi:spore coat protein U-like protein
MKNSTNADLMTYQLYRDSFGGTVWGDGAIGGSVSSIPINVSTSCPTQTTITAPTGLTVFGRIFPLQSVSAGTYGDTVTITVTP